MANEHLKRTPTSTGNRKKWTWAGWVKLNKDFDSGDYNTVWSVAAGTSGNNSDRFHLYHINGSWQVTGTSSFSPTLTGPGGIGANSRDPGAWLHICLSVDTTVSNLVKDKYQRFWVNGIEYNYDDLGNIADNADLAINGPYEHYIGTRNSSAQRSYDGQMFDLYLVDGQALTPDVFGFYKDGKGYQSSGNKFETDFRPGQWSPHLPRKVKSDIERRGGFGVNGFYLPMNSSNNFGADFHTTPNTILKLKENLPQPKSEIDGGGNYTGALRDDPYKDNLVLAIPGVINGLGSGYGDYSADIKGSGTNKTVIANGSAGVTACASHYGSAMSFPNGGSSGGDDALRVTSSDFAFGTGDFTVEVWINPDSVYNYKTIFATRPNNSGHTDGFNMWIDGNGKTGVYSNAFLTQTASGTITPNQWTHVVAERHNGKLTTYINGVAADIQSSNTQNYTRTVASIGLLAAANQESFTGQMQDLRVYKGLAKYKGGFDVNKPYTPEGIETWRAVPDNCKNNFCTLNPLNTSQLVPTNGNLSINQSSGGWHSLLGTHYARSGKWYAEMRIDRLGWIFFGVEQTWLETRTRHVGGQTGSKGAGLVYNTGNRGDITYNGTNSAYTGGDATAATGDIISIALDLDTNSVKFYKNNVLQYDLSNVLESGADYAFGVSPYSDVAATVNFGQNPTFSGQITAGTHTDSNGKGLFKYQPPAGYLALCDDNLPTPAVADPGKHFKCVLYEGIGGLRTISNVGFKPDLVWVKCRSHSKWHALFDSVRGNNKMLSSNSANAESTEIQIPAFNENGFTVDDIDSGTANENGFDYVAWCWKAGGPAVTNTDGSITSQVSANQAAGFSIVSYTGNYTAGATIGHGLGKKPSFMIVKERTGASGWFVYHEDLGATKFLSLHDVTAAGTETGNTACWYETEPNASVFTVGQNGATNENNRPIIAYCWTEIEGYSRFGSYLGNGNVDGPFVYCGFKPAWLMIKPYGSGNGCYSGGYTSWSIYDSSRSSVNNASMHERVLFANRAYEEGKRGQGSASGNFQNIDIVSNGFKIRGQSNCETNTTSISGFIFVAFAESPFQTANAK